MCGFVWMFCGIMLKWVMYEWENLLNKFKCWRENENKNWKIKRWLNENRINVFLFGYKINEKEVMGVLCNYDIYI